MNLITFLRKVKRRLVVYSLQINYRPATKKTVIFESFGGRQISDSPLAIYEQMKKDHPEYRLVWVINKDKVATVEAAGYDYVIRGTFKWAKTIEKAHIWVENARLPAWVRKPEHVKLIQTWHGTPLKKLGLDIEKVTMPGTTTERYHANFVKEANRWDVLISPNAYSTSIFRQAFGYQNQILESGYPRNDVLANPSTEQITALKQKLGIPLDKKVIMYAPTYRDNQFFKKGKYSFKLPFSLKNFQERFGEDTVLLLRMHYLISNAMDISGFEDFAYDVSSYPNISDLYLVSDVLVTDYSSVFFDYAYLKRPVVFFPYDYEVYKDELRGFYLDYQTELPGEIVYNPDALRDGITRALAAEDMSQNAQFMKFYDRFCQIHAGDASQKVIEEMIKS
jgi:CDP-glycerol glycerophosphotransferase